MAILIGILGAYCLLEAAYPDGAAGYLHDLGTIFEAVAAGGVGF